LKTDAPGTATGVRWLRGGRQIRNLRKSGKPIRGSFFFARVGRAGPSDEGVAGVAIVTGRGFAGAVRRNLARRRARGALLDLREMLLEGREYLLECRPGCEGADYQKLVIDLRGILSRAENCEEKRQRTPGGG
jgi:ribonuclease P protein component